MTKATVMPAKEKLKDIATLDQGGIKPGHQLVPVKKARRVSARKKTVEQALTEVSSDSPKYIKEVKIAEATFNAILEHSALMCAYGEGDTDEFFKDVAKAESDNNFILMAALNKLLDLKIRRMKRP